MPQYMPFIYLDNNATTPVDPLVLDAMLDCYQINSANPASQHQLGNQARRLLEDARDSIASTLGTNIRHGDGDLLVFTSGATESNNLALRGLAGPQPGKIVTSTIEHPSLLGPAEYLKRANWDWQQISVDSSGLIDLDQAATLITPDTQLVSVMLGNHETGALQPLKEISALCCSAGVPLHTDATQAVGKIPVDFHELGVDALSFSAHKFHGPAGIGGLLLKRGTNLHPLLYGGFQQLGLRPGREPVALAVGMQVALELWSQQAVKHEKALLDMRDRFESQLLERLPWVSITCQQSSRLPHVSNVAFPGLNRQTLMMALDQGGLACSTGSACASGSTDPSPVLRAMGLEESLVEGALRFSFGRHNQATESHLAADLVETTASRLRGTNPSEKTVSEPPQQPTKRL
jgi:cysteine desulfurase